MLISPGMLSSHYAPRAQVRLMARDVAPGEALITFAGQACRGQERAALVLDLQPQAIWPNGAAAVRNAASG